MAASRRALGTSLRSVDAHVRLLLGVRTETQIAPFLTFARCIRSHGSRAFPDPTSSGELTHQMVATAGISLRQPAVLQAGDA